LGTSKCMEILKEEVGFKFTISVFEASTTSSLNYKGSRQGSIGHNRITCIPSYDDGIRPIEIK
jgi:hypothetical protein